MDGRLHIRVLKPKDVFLKLLTIVIVELETGGPRGGGGKREFFVISLRRKVRTFFLNRF